MIGRLGVGHDRRSVGAVAVFDLPAGVEPGVVAGPPAGPPRLQGRRAVGVVSRGRRSPPRNSRPRLALADRAVRSYCGGTGPRRHCESADQLGMSVLADRLRVAADRLHHHGCVRITRRHGAPQAGWTVEFAGRRSHVRHLVGMRYLAVLAASPCRWIDTAELASDAPTAPPSRRQPLLDARACRSLEQRVRELAARVAEARERGDVTAQAVARRSSTVWRPTLLRRRRSVAVPAPSPMAGSARGLWSARR